MGKLIFISGGFSSGTTLLFTMFRQVQGCYCLYEPLHEKLLPWLFWPPRAYEGHANVGTYYDEYKGFDAIPALFDPSWGISGLYLGPDESADSLYRYLAYVIGSAYGRAPHVVVKENRFSFRLGWLRANFPPARIVHVYRDLDDHWRSIVGRVQREIGREDVGQDSVDFMGFRMAAWCDDLAAHFPELSRGSSSSGYERFAKLWALSKQEQERYADVTVELGELKRDFPSAVARISSAVGLELDAPALGRILDTEGRRKGHTALGRRFDRLVNRAGARYAEARVSYAARRRKR
jgi:hypothetical protein